MSERAQLAFTCKQVGPRTIETTLSSSRTDRMKDVIHQNWQLADYRRNPVIFWNHQTHALPIARSIWIGVVDGQLRSRDEFPPIGMYPFADQVHDLVVAGFINAKSVGFLPLKKVYDEQRNGWDFLENSLLEHSYVGLPANVDAVIDGRAVPDEAAVRRWFGGDGASILRFDPSASVVDLDDEEVDVDRRDVVAAIRVAIPALVAAEVGQHRGRLDGIDLDGIDGAFDPVASDTDRRLLLEAMGVAIPALVRREIDKLRGRISDD
jgi:hypothetical protein